MKIIFFINHFSLEGGGGFLLGFGGKRDYLLVETIT